MTTPHLNSYDLYAVTMDGSAWRKLNPTLSNGQTVSSYQLTPNNWGVVYRSNFSGNFQLYSRDLYATIDPMQLTNAANWQFIDTVFRITPNSQYVVYIADLNTDNMFEVYSFPTVGTSYALTLRWNLPFSQSGSDANGIIVMPDSSSLIYTADREIDEQMQVYYAYYAYPVYLPNISR